MRLQRSPYQLSDQLGVFDEEQASVASLRALSVEGILRKPFDVEELVATLARLMQAPAGRSSDG